MIHIPRHPASAPRAYLLILLVAMFGLAAGFSSRVEAADSCGLDYQCYYDRAKAAVQDIIDGLKETIGLLEEEVEDLEGQLQAPIDIANDVATMIDKNTLGALGLDTDTLVRINQAVEFINGQNQALLEDFNNFQTESTDFRNRLATLLRQASRVTSLSTEILEMQRQLDSSFQAPWPVLRIDANKLADHIENVPATMLFPLYYALNGIAQGSSPSFDYVTASNSGCVANYCQFFVPLETIIDGIDQRLVQLQTILNSLNASYANEVPTGRNLAAQIDYPRNLLCYALFQDPAVPDQVSSITSYIAVGSTILNEVGNFFTKAKVTVVEGDWSGGFSFAAEVQLSVKRRPGAMFGAIVKLLTGPTRMIAEGIGTKVSDCRQRLEQHLVICGIANDVKQNATFRNCKSRIIDDKEPFGY